MKLSINCLKNLLQINEYRNKIIFDGYPRNINQAESLEIMLNRDNQSINFILLLKVPMRNYRKKNFR